MTIDITAQQARENVDAFKPDYREDLNNVLSWIEQLSKSGERKFSQRINHEAKDLIQSELTRRGFEWRYDPESNYLIVMW